MNQTKRRLICRSVVCLPVLLWFVLCAPRLYAAGPGTITYQGTVTESGGTTPDDGDYAMRFSVFDQATGGTQQWQEAHSAVWVTDGRFVVDLGSVSSLGSTLFEEAASLWLEVEVDLDGADGFEADEKYSPRVPLTATPYAFQADNADLLDGQDAAAFAATAHGHNLQDLPGAVVDAQVPDDITVTYAASAGDADTLDGQDATEFAATAHGHDLQDLSGAVVDAQVPDDVTVTYAAAAGDADTLDGQDATEFAATAHGHNLQDLSGAVVDAQVPNDITVTYAASAGDADTLDGQDATAFAATAHGHNLQDLSGAVLDAQVPNDITVNYAGSAGNADTLDGQHAAAFMAAGTDHWVNTTGDTMTGRLALDASRSGYLLTVTNSSSLGNAIQGSTSSPGTLAGTAKAVSGYASNTGATATNYGGYFGAAGGNGRGVYGEAPNTGTSATNYGGYFKADGGNGRGVFAKASGDYGRGVYGWASDTGNVTNYGGFFEAAGASARGVYGEATAAGDVLNYGVVGVASGYSGRGVYGSATATGDVRNFGGKFEAKGDRGQAVWGEATATGSVINYGGLFIAHGHNGRGVFGSGGAGGYDFYASGAGTDYGPFTGAHEVKLANDFPESVQPGLIVSATGDTQVRRDGDGAVSLSSTLPTVRLADTPNDKAVAGVLVAEAPLPEEHWYDAQDGDRFGIANALGEGRVWVADINGAIEPGDYVTTSSIPGYGQRQDDDLLRSCTLGKAIETVDWDAVTETVEFNEQPVKVYLIAVFYTSG